MNGRTEVNSGFDTFKLVLSIAILAAGVYGFYFWAAQPLFYRVGGMLVVVTLAAVIAARTAIGECSVTVIFTLSPGITISTPLGSSHEPVTSVVRK